MLSKALQNVLIRDYKRPKKVKKKISKKIFKSNIADPIGNQPDSKRAGVSFAKKVQIENSNSSIKEIDVKDNISNSKLPKNRLRCNNSQRVMACDAEHNKELGSTNSQICEPRLTRNCLKRFIESSGSYLFSQYEVVSNVGGNSCDSPDIFKENNPSSERKPESDTRHGVTRAIGNSSQHSTIEEAWRSPKDCPKVFFPSKDNSEYIEESIRLDDSQFNLDAAASKDSNENKNGESISNLRNQTCGPTVLKAPKKTYKKKKLSESTMEKCNIKKCGERTKHIIKFENEERLQELIEAYLLSKASFQGTMQFLQKSNSSIPQFCYNWQQTLRGNLDNKFNINVRSFLPNPLKELQENASNILACSNALLEAQKFVA